MKKETALVKNSKPLLWGSVMAQDKVIGLVANKVAQIYGVPPMCVTMLGSQPYLNKDARLFLAGELRPIKNITTEFLLLAEEVGGHSICKKLIEFEDGSIVTAIGEASKESIKLSGVQVTTNMMSETRALNRAIWQAIAFKVYGRVKRNLTLMDVTEEEAKAVTEAGRVSAEEVTDTGKTKAQPKMTETQLFKTVGDMIKNPDHSKGTLLDLVAKVEADKRFTTAHKKELLDELSLRVDKLEK